MRYLCDVDLKDPGLYDVHIREEVHRRPGGEDRRVDVDIVKARVLEVDVEEIAHPGRLLNVIPADELGDDLRRDAFLPLGRQGGGHPRPPLGKGTADSPPTPAGHATDHPLPPPPHHPTTASH